MTPARALERAVALPNDANLANDRRRRHRSTSARARETRDGRSGTRARAIADGESKREDANAANAAEDANEASRGVTSTVSATVRRTRAIAGMLEGKDQKVAEAELKALTSRAANETSSLLEDLAPYARPSEDAAWEEYERAREDAMRRGVAFSAVMGMGVAAVTSTVGADALLASVESIPPLAAFEQLLGIAVTLYYGTVYRRLLTTSEGRRGLRLSFAEAFSQISGAAELVGRSAATNAALDGAVCKTMEDIRAMPSNEVPPSVIRAMDVYVRSRDEEKRRLKSAAVEREREAVRLQREREAKAKAMERERANQKREREQAMERRKREMEAKAAAVKRERDAKEREREAKAEAARKEREAKAEAAQREREMKAMGAEEAQAAREAYAKAEQEAKEAQAKAAQEAKEAQAKAAQDERDAQAAKVAQDERDAQAAKAAQEARDAQAAKAAQDEREAQAAKESQAPPVTSVVTTTDETVTESVNEEIENLRAKLAAQTEKFEHVSKDLEKLMEDDSAAKSALKEARTEIETLRAQLADMEARMNEEVERSRLAADEMERRLAEADKRASELHDELRRERESAAKTLEEITRERDELTAKLRAAQTAASSASSEASNDKMNAQLAQLERELQLAKDDIDLERQQIREEAAAEIQSLTERAAQELAEAESRFAAQLEEVEARLAAAEIAARDAESNAESIAKAAAAAQTEAKSSTSPTPVTVADASATERPAIVFDPTALVALSKMKRDELVAEAEARGLDSTGVAAELRNRLRDARAIEKRAFTQKRRAQSRKKPTGYYRVIATVKYDNELLSAADDIMAEFGEINRVGVEKLFTKLFDGAGVTEVELRTMDILLAGGGGRYEYILTDPAVAHLQPRLDAVRAIQARNVGFTRSTSQYTVEDGIKYDDGLLSFARSIAATAQSVDVIRAEIVFNTALDGGRVTDAEFATLERVLSSRDEFPLDADARAWFERALERVKSER